MSSTCPLRRGAFFYLPTYGVPSVGFDSHLRLLRTHCNAAASSTGFDREYRKGKHFEYRKGKDLAEGTMCLRSRVPKGKSETDDDGLGGARKGP
jgi:hypothetical protein